MSLLKKKGSPPEELGGVRIQINLMAIRFREQEIWEKLPLELKGAVQAKIRLCEIPPINLYLNAASVVVLLIS